MIINVKEGILMEVNITQETCINCGIVFWITLSFMEQRRKDHHIFYCPNGHSMYYSAKNKEETLKEQLVSLQRQFTICQNSVVALENTNRTLKGTITKMKKKK